MAVCFQIPPEWPQLSANERVEFVCRVFEEAWRHGQDPRTEDYLGSSADLDREPLCIRLCALERRLRQERRQDLALSECVRRFPQYEAALIRHFGQEESADATVDSTILFPAQPGSSPNTAPPLPTKCQFGRYLLEELLGRGAFGEVWRASDPMLSRKVAVKCVRADRPLTQEAAERFLNEARRLALLDHPGIVRVYDVGLEDGVPYIVSQLIDGETLGERMRRASVDQDEAARIVAQISDAAHAAHLQGIVHRDIKPSNIILDSRGKAYLADFGLAVTEEEQLHEPAGVMGTYAYMSPEQLRGDSNRTDARADVYGLGAVLYRLLTGRNLFVGDTPEEYREQALSRDVRPPRTIDDSIRESLEQICLRCLKRDATARFTTARDLAKALIAATDKPTPRSWPKRHVALSLAAITLAITGTWQLVGTGKPPRHNIADSSNEPLAPSSDEFFPADDSSITRRSPPRVRDLATSDGTYSITPVVWTFSGLPVEWGIRKGGHTLSAECSGAAVIAFARLDASETLIELDLQQLRWAGGIGLAYGAQTGGGEVTATTTFNALDFRPRFDKSWAVTRLLCEQSNLRPSDGWNTTGIDALPIADPVSDVLPVRLRFQSGRLTELAVSHKHLELSPASLETENDADGNAFGLVLHRAGGSVSNLKINGRGATFRVPASRTR